MFDRSRVMKLPDDQVNRTLIRCKDSDLVKLLSYLIPVSVNSNCEDCFHQEHMHTVLWHAG